MPIGIARSSQEQRLPDWLAGEDGRPHREERPASAEQVFDHALEAVQRAGHDPDKLKVLPVDVGVITYHGNQDPMIHRTWAVEDDCDYIQPFVQLRVPRQASGRIRFELLDNTGQVVFVHEDKYQLERGRNLITPSARLPIHAEQEIDGSWQLHIMADNVMLAQHAFDWEETANPKFSRHIGEDGEISSQLRAVLAESRLEEMSLDDLLAHQEEDVQQARQ